MGVLRETLALGASRIITILFTLFTGFLIVRKLDAHSYAVYQIATKKLFTYFATPLNIIAFWAYRYTARSISGSLLAYTRVSLLIASVSWPVTFLIVYTLHRAFVDSLLLSLCTSLMVFYVSLTQVLIACCSSSVSISTSIRSAFHALLLLLFMKLTGLTLALVSIGCSASILAALFVLAPALTRAARKTRCPGCIREWLRGSLVLLPFLIASYLTSADAIIASLLASPQLAAFFFALTLIPRLVTDVAGWSLGHIHAYILKTRDLYYSLSALKLVSLLAFFVLAYSMSTPSQIIAFSGARYISASNALVVISLAYALYLIDHILGFVLNGLDESRADKPGRLLRANIGSNIAGAVCYITVLTAALLLFRNESVVTLLEMWGASLAIAMLISVLLKLYALESYIRARILKHFILPSTSYLILAYIASSVLADKRYSTIFINNLVITASSIVKPLVVYLLMILAVDADVRYIIASFFMRILKRYLPRLRAGYPHHG